MNNTKNNTFSDLMDKIITARIDTGGKGERDQKWCEEFPPR